MMTRDEVSRTRRRTRQPRGLTYAEQETAPKVRPEPKEFLIKRRGGRVRYHPHTYIGLHHR